MDGQSISQKKGYPMSLQRSAYLTMVGMLLIGLLAGCNAKRRHLLSEVDHQALLKACREVLALELQVGRYKIGQSPRHPAVSRFPKAILDLAPSYVRIEQTNGSSYLALEMHGGFDHFGVYAYPEDFKEPHASFRYGDRKLIDGLWYYDEEYNYDPEYGRRVDGWLKQGKHVGNSADAEGKP
jgi:hypothetical protein